MPGVRTRNESAWLLPNDGSRTDHRQRDGMRRFADTDELDLVIVGCGAGGAVLLQRLGPGRWGGAGPGAGPVLGPPTGRGRGEGRAPPPDWGQARGGRGARPRAAGADKSRPG